MFQVNGANRWVDLGIFSFQSSEPVKILLIIFYAWLLSNIMERNNINKFVKGFIFPLLWLLPVMGILVLVQNHLSATIVIVLIIGIMMLIAGVKMRYFLGCGIPVAILGIVVLFLRAIITGEGAFRLNRLTSFFDPFKDATNTGYQVVQSLYAIGSGGLFGVGLGKSTQKYLYLPEAHNDFIFSIIAEELGFVGCIFIISLFVIFIWRGIIIAVNAKDTFGSLIAIGITSMIGLQALINIGVVTSSIPNTGMSLPFFSYGGTSLIILLISVGVLLNISRTIDLK